MEIQIDSAGLSEISDAGQVVTVTRCVNQSVDTVASAAAANAGALTVAWQTFQPMQINDINWTDDQYYCFATTTPLVMNAVIAVISQSGSPMQIGFVYEFAQGQFTMQQTQQGGDWYIVSNATPGSYAFGLAQSATVNNVPVLAPFCVMPILYNQAAYFIPSAMIGVFLSTASAAGALLPPPSANACFVSAPSGAVTEPTIGFNDQTNTFHQIS
jgi:hypothetical protein